MAKLKRIVMHWTGGNASASVTDLNHYHALTEQSGRTVYGKYKPEDNIKIKRGHYAAHTRALNTGSIGLAMCGMYGAKEVPFSPGNHPITCEQVKAFAGLVAEFAHTYGIPITRKTVLFHAEVERTLGVWQRQKWDVTWLPDMEKPGGALEVGDRMRYMIASQMPATRKSFWGRLVS